MALERQMPAADRTFGQQCSPTFERIGTGCGISNGARCEVSGAELSTKGVR
jgi:hypothetical protein